MNIPQIAKAVAHWVTRAGYCAEIELSRQSRSRYVWVSDNETDAEWLFAIRVSDHMNPALRPFRTAGDGDRATQADVEIGPEDDWRLKTVEALEHAKKLDAEIEPYEVQTYRVRWRDSHGAVNVQDIQEISPVSARIRVTFAHDVAEVIEVRPLGPGEAEDVLGAAQ